MADTPCPICGLRLPDPQGSGAQGVTTAKWHQWVRALAVSVAAYVALAVLEAVAGVAFAMFTSAVVFWVCVGLLLASREATHG
jgi:hypothetical protein